MRTGESDMRNSLSQWVFLSLLCKCISQTKAYWKNLSNEIALRVLWLLPNAKESLIAADLHICQDL
jgi:hypothetical protein